MKGSKKKIKKEEKEKVIGELRQREAEQEKQKAKQEKMLRRLKKMEEKMLVGS